jgi:hypothetical protein
VNNDNTIWTNASLTPNLQPCVIWQYKQFSGFYGLPEARAKGRGILEAAAIAQAEANIVMELATSVIKPSKGFGNDSYEKDAQMVGLLNMVRKARTHGAQLSPLIPGVIPILGFETKQPLLDLLWYGESIQMELTSANYHGETLLRTAEVAESDAFLRFFLSQQCSVPLENTQIMIENFGLYRNQQSLEQLIGLE